MLRHGQTAGPSSSPIWARNLVKRKKFNYVLMPLYTFLRTFSSAFYHPSYANIPSSAEDLSFINVSVKNHIKQSRHVTLTDDEKKIFYSRVKVRRRFLLVMIEQISRNIKNFIPRDQRSAWSQIFLHAIELTFTIQLVSFLFWWSNFLLRLSSLVLFLLLV